MNEDITYGIQATIWNSVKKSLENDNIETFKVLNNFIIEVIQLSITNKTLNHFKKYITFPASYYSTSYAKSKENIKYYKLHEYSTERASEILFSILNYMLQYSDDLNPVNIPNLQLTNQFLYPAYNGYSRLLYQIVSNNDIQMFNKVVTQFRQINKFNDTFQELKWKIRSNKQEPEKAVQDMELYQEIKKGNDYKRHVLTGLNYWAVFLYSAEKMDEKTAAVFLEKLQIPADSEDILSDIIFFRSNPQYDYLEWTHWDYMERPNGIAYSPPNPNHWLTFGFLLNLIRDNRFYFSPASLQRHELSQCLYLYQTLKEGTAYFTKNFDKWKSLLKVDSIQSLQDKTAQILESFKGLKQESINQRDNEIAAANLDPAKIEEFKNLVGKAWENTAFIRSLFQNRNNIETVEDGIKFIGQKTFFQQGKMMFINNEHYQTIYNISEIGGETGRWMEDTFLNSVIGPQSNSVSDENIVGLIRKCVAFLTAEDVKPNVIILPSAYSYKDENFLNQKNFVRKIDIPGMDRNGVLYKYLLGRFDDIEVYTSFSDVLDNMILVADFEKAFKMKYKVDEQWFNNELKVNVTEIDDQAAEEKYELNPDKWTRRDAEMDLTKDQAIVLIKNAVNMEIGSHNEFEIVDNNSFVVGLLQNSIE